MISQQPLFPPFSAIVSCGRHNVLKPCFVIFLTAFLSCVVPQILTAQTSTKPARKSPSTHITSTETTPTQAQAWENFPPAYPQIRVGLFGAGHLNWHTADFIELPGIQKLNKTFGEPDTIRFGGAQSIVPSFGVAFESALSPFIGVSARFSYAVHNITLSATEPIFLPTQDFSFIDAQLNHFLPANLSSLAIEPTAIITPLGNPESLKLYLGGRIGFMLTRTFEQRTVLPDEYRRVALPQNPFEHNAASATLPNLNEIPLSILGGVGYEIPIPGLNLAEGMGRLSVQPEVFGMWSLNSVVRDLQWNIHQFRAGISLFYRQEEIIQRYEERRQIDTVIVYQKRVRIPFMVGISTFSRDTLLTAEAGKRVRSVTETLRRVDTLFTTPPPRMDVEISAVGVNEKGEEKKIAQLRVEEFVVQRYVPLLNYVFFDDQSSTLHERYTRLSSDASALFDIDKLYQSNTLEIYRTMLNIIGKRMRQFPDAVITLTGCNSDVGAEEGNIALSVARAEAVRKYLLDVWNIGANRIIVKSRNLSAEASVPKTEPDKIEENRRVEITSSVREVLDPVLLSDTMRLANPPTIRFRPSVKTEESVKDWTLVAFNDGQDVKQFSSEDSANVEHTIMAGQSEPAQLPVKIDWTPPKQGEKSLKLTGAPLEFTLTARDVGGKSGFAHGFLPVQRVVLPDKKIEQFSLVLFGFNKAEISEQNQRIIQFISSIITPKSKVSIAGYTDRTGDNAYNRTLSRQRASELARIIDQPLAKAQGFGEDTLLYDNTTPEGRFYCRTVNVSVETVGGG